MWISEAAEQAGVNVQTVRYYERRGLLPKAPRRASGYREFPADAVARVRFIKRAQELGFSLDEVESSSSFSEVRDETAGESGRSPNGESPRSTRKSRSSRGCARR
jgi:Predicted transcriptional regulators